MSLWHSHTFVSVDRGFPLGGGNVAIGVAEVSKSAVSTLPISIAILVSLFYSKVSLESNLDKNPILRDICMENHYLDSIQ